jgi:cell division septum initiation protein DivIVA
MNRIVVFLLLAGILPIVTSGQDRDQRIADLERKIAEAKGSVAALQKTIESLSTEVQALRQPDPKSPPKSSVVASTAALVCAEGRFLTRTSGKLQRILREAEVRRAL